MAKNELEKIDKVCQQVFQENYSRTERMQIIFQKAENEVPLSHEAERIAKIVGDLNSLAIKCFTSGVSEEDAEDTLALLLWIRRELNKVARP